MADFLPSELVITPKGGVYHLDICPDDLAHKIVVVGDQDRVELVSNFFDEVTHKSQHREFACHTGLYKGKNISVISTGIGTDNIDIVINELDADRKSTRLNSSHVRISYAVFCLKKKKKK